MITVTSADVIERLRGVRDPDFLRLIDEAAQGETAPVPDVVEPYRWFLARLGAGVTLTSAGRLPPALFTETMQTLGWDVDWIGAGNREELTIPVAELRHSARSLGLVRVHRGRLLPTVLGRRLAHDPAGLWQHIAEKLPLGRSDVERHGGVLWLLAIAAGRRDSDRLVARGLGLLGWVGRSNSRPPDTRDAAAVVRDTRAVSDRLGLVSSWPRSLGPLPEPARALARAALFGGAESAQATSPAPVQSTSGSALELTVTLRDVQPPVWRRIVVPESLTLRELHAVLQTAMG